MLTQVFKKFLVPFLLVLLTLSLCVSVFFYNKYRDIRLTSEQKNAKELSSLLKKISKLILLPNDEEPALATITDPEKLKSESFFKNAKIGDKMLIYVKAQKAYLYDPVKNIIIDVGSTFDSSQGVQSEIDEQKMLPKNNQLPIKK